MTTTPLQKFTAIISLISGIVLIGISLAIFILSEKQQGTLTIGNFELTATEPILLIILGAVLINVPWLPKLLWNPNKDTTQNLKEGEFKIKPYSQKKEKGNEVIVDNNQARFEFPENENDWEVVKMTEYQSIEDVSIFELPLFANLQSLIFPVASAERYINPISYTYLKHYSTIKIILDEETLVDNFRYSGELPDNERIRSRILDSVVGSMLTEIRFSILSNPVLVEKYWTEFNIKKSIPINRYGNPDIDEALKVLHSSLYDSIKNEEKNEIINNLLNIIKKQDLPVSKNLHHSASFRIYDQQDILNKDPFLSLMYGGDLSLWQFVINLMQVDPEINISQASNIKWNENGTTVSFIISTNLNQATVNKQRTSLEIKRIYYILKNGKQFHLLKINLLSGPGTFEKYVYKDLEKILGSYRIHIPNVK